MTFLPCICFSFGSVSYNARFVCAWNASRLETASWGSVGLHSVSTAHALVTHAVFAQSQCILHVGVPIRTCYPRAPLDTKSDAGRSHLNPRHMSGRKSSLELLADDFRQGEPINHSHGHGLSMRSELRGRPLRPFRRPAKLAPEDTAGQSPRGSGVGRRRPRWGTGIRRVRWPRCRASKRRTTCSASAGRTSPPTPSVSFLCLSWLILADISPLSTCASTATVARSALYSRRHPSSAAGSKVCSTISSSTASAAGANHPHSGRDHSLVRGTGCQAPWLGHQRPHLASPHRRRRCAPVSSGAGRRALITCLS
jgi:hypothetical protein